MSTSYARGRVTPEQVRERVARDQWADEFPEPTPEQAASIEATITAYLKAAGDRLVSEAKLRRLFPPEPVEVRADFVPYVVSRMWERGALWAVSTKGKYRVTLGDAADAARAERGRLNSDPAPPLAI